MSGNNNKVKLLNNKITKQKDDPIVLLVDMDCFYCQVEEKCDPSLKGKPIAVVQHNDWLGGGIIAVNYAARDKGVTRHMRGDEAKERCPELQLVKVPNVNQKADLGKYRDAGKEVAKVLQGFTKLLERASIDEAYLDVTESVTKRLSVMNKGSFVLQPEQLFNTFAVGYGSIGEFISVISCALTTSEEKSDESNNKANSDSDPQADLRLLVGASIANEIRQKIKSETGYECSAGIAHNKVCAKLACGLNKPNKQTIFPMSKVSTLFDTLPVRKIPGLGGKFGKEIVERLAIQYVGELTKFSESDLIKHFDEKNGNWLYNICRGMDFEPVTPRLQSKSIGCCKKFPGRTAITGLKQLNHWLLKLAEEVSDRLEEDAMENQRKAKQMTLSFVQSINNEEVCNSRSVSISAYEASSLAQQCLEILKSNTKQFLRNETCTALNNPIHFLGISVGKFEAIANNKHTLERLFQCQIAKNERRNNALSNRSENETTASERRQDTREDENQKAKRLRLDCEKTSVLNLNNAMADMEAVVPRDEAIVEEKYESNATVLEGNGTAGGIVDSSENANSVERNTKHPVPVVASFFKKELMENKNGDLDRGSKTRGYLSNENIPLNSSKELDLATEHEVVDENVQALEDVSVCEKVEFPTPKPSSTRSLKNAFFKDIVSGCEEAGTAALKSTDVSPLENKATLCENFTDQATTSGTSQEIVDDCIPSCSFLVPPFLGNHRLKSCDICGERMLDDEFIWQIHSDKHFAEALDKEEKQRAKSQAPKPIVIKSSSSKMSKQRNKPPNKSNMSIKQFFSSNNSRSSAIQSQPVAPAEASTASFEVVTTKCKYCELVFKNRAELTEHEDYHLAQLLQAE